MRKLSFAELLERIRATVAANQKVAVRAPGRHVRIEKGIIPWPGRPAARARHHAGSGRRP